MATAALSICTPAAATPCLAIAAPAPTPANDTSAPAIWTADPRAVRLLASCVALQPKGTFHRSRYGNAADEWFAYDGYRAEALEAIRMEHGDRLLQAYHQHGDAAYPAFRQWAEQPNATGAITAALSASVEA